LVVVKVQLRDIIGRFFNTFQICKQDYSTKKY